MNYLCRKRSLHLELRNQRVSQWIFSGIWVNSVQVFYFVNFKYLSNFHIFDLYFYFCLIFSVDKSRNGFLCSYTYFSFSCKAASAYILASMTCQVY